MFGIHEPIGVLKGLGKNHDQEQTHKEIGEGSVCLICSAC